MNCVLQSGLADFGHGKKCPDVQECVCVYICPVMIDFAQIPKPAFFSERYWVLLSNPYFLMKLCMSVHIRVDETGSSFQSCITLFCFLLDFYLETGT